MKVTHEEYPKIPKTLGNKRKLAFIFSSSFRRLIRNYLGLLHLPFWEFNYFFFHTCKFVLSLF